MRVRVSVRVRVRVRVRVAVSESGECRGHQPRGVNTKRCTIEDLADLHGWVGMMYVCKWGMVYVCKRGMVYVHTAMCVCVCVCMCVRVGAWVGGWGMRCRYMCVVGGWGRCSCIRVLYRYMRTCRCQHTC